MDATRLGGFYEEGYRVSWRLTPSELRRAHALRADVFCRELRWVGSSHVALERDEFDGDSVHLAVFEGGSRLVAAVRLTRGDAPWMLDTVFRHLLPSHGALRRSGAVEASRLAVAPESRNARLAGGKRVCDLLYKAAHAFCRAHGVRTAYMVTSDVVLRHMTRAGLPCAAMAAPTLMPDGVRALPVVLDWHALRRDPALHRWYMTGWRAPPAPLPFPLVQGAAESVAA
jgi:N-acyl-L-homoserine lactone synthetase